jgi:hypothetical protein
MGSWAYHQHEASPITKLLEAVAATIFKSTSGAHFGRPSSSKPPAAPSRQPWPSILAETPTPTTTQPRSPTMTHVNRWTVREAVGYRPVRMARVEVPWIGPGRWMELSGMFNISQSGGCPSPPQVRHAWAAMLFGLPFMLRQGDEGALVSRQRDGDGVGVLWGLARLGWGRD